MKRPRVLHLELAGLDAFVAHVARHLEAGEHARRRSAHSDGAVLPLGLGAMGHVSASHAPPLDAACAAQAFEKG